MGKDYTKQHIVPQRYLDRFGTKDGKRTIIGTRIVVNGEPRLFPESTANVGYIKNYYDVTDKNDPKYWEHFFAKQIDSLCGQNMESLIGKINLTQDGIPVLTAQDKEMLSRVIVAQLMRIPANVDYVKNTIYPRISKRIKKDLTSMLPDFLVEKYGEQIQNTELPEQYQKEVILNHAFEPDNFDRYCDVLRGNIWSVFVNKRSNTMPFFTSDNPVIVEGYGKTGTGLFHHGLASPTTCIYYPLTPSIAVVIYSRQGIVGLAAEKYEDRKVLLDDMKYIAKKNLTMMEQAYTHSFIPQPIFDTMRTQMT